jgi:CopG family transcriptional regulator, nickel-responsive regulator
VRSLIADNKERNGMSSEVDAILVATHDQATEEAVTRLKHAFEDIVKTHLHNKLSRRSCAELFLVQGEGPKIASMASAFQKDDGMKSVKLVLV